MIYDKRFAAKGYWLALALVMAAAILYRPVLQLDYAWDDTPLFVDNPELRTGDIEWSKLVKPVLPATSYTRPLVLWTFMIEFRYLGLAPSISHSINYAIYLINVCLVLLLAWRHFKWRGLPRAAERAALAGAMYAIHPALVESTAWVSGRFDLLATMFVLLTLIADLSIKRPVLRAAMVSSGFALALGSKEVAAALPVLLVLQRLALEPAQTSIPGQVAELLRRHLWTIVLCAAVGLVYLLVRLGTSGRIAPPTTVGEALGTPAAHVAYVLQTVVFYIEQALAPLVGKTMPIHPAHPEDVLKFPGLLRVAFALVFLATVILAVMRRRYLGWMVLAALCALLPVLNIVVLPMAGNIGCDRFLTLPLAFVCLGLCGVNVAVPGLRPKLAKGIVGICLIVWSISATATVFATIPIWRNDSTLWGWLYEQPLTRSNAWPNFASSLLRAGRYTEALQIYNERLKLGPLDAGQQINYGLVLAMTGEAEEGIRYIEGALSVYPPVSPAKIMDGKTKSGIDAFLRDYIGLGHYALAQSKFVLGDVPSALREIETALLYRPITPSFISFRGLLLEEVGRSTEAQSEFERALSLSHPTTRQVLLNERDRFHRMVAQRRANAASAHQQ